MQVPPPTSLHPDPNLRNLHRPSCPAKKLTHADDPQHPTDQVHLSSANSVPIAGRSQSAPVLYDQSGRTQHQVDALLPLAAIDRLLPSAMQPTMRRVKRSINANDMSPPPRTRAGRYLADIVQPQNTRIKTLVSALTTANETVNAILAMQPRFLTVTSALLKQKLAESFPHLLAANSNTSVAAVPMIERASSTSLANAASHDPAPRSINLDGIYLNTFHEDKRGRRHEDGSYTIDTLRYQTSSQTLSQVLQAYLKAPVAPVYNPHQMGFYDRPAATAETHKLAPSEAFAAVMADVRLQSLHAYQHALYHFWTTATAADGKSPLARLSAIRDTQLEAESALRFADGTLSATGKALIDDLRQPPAGIASPSVFSMALKQQHYTDDIPFSGAFILTRPSIAQPTANPAILYLPGHGIEEFATFAELQESLRQRFHDKSRRELLLPYIARHNLQHVRGMDITAQENTWLRYSPINADVATDRVYSQLIQALENVAHDWRMIVAPDDDGATMPDNRSTIIVTNNTAGLATQLDTTATLDGLFSIAAVMAHRQQKIGRQRIEQNQALQQRIEARQQIVQQQEALQQRRQQAQDKLQTWLKQLTTTEQANWLQALQNYHVARQRAEVSGLPAASEYGNKAFLDSYAKQQLQRRIMTDHGIDADPDQIIVTTTHSEVTAFPLSQSAYNSHAQRERIGPVITRHTTQKKLAQIALDNVGKLDLGYWSTAAVWAADGKKHPQLTPEYVKQIVRDLNIGQSYPDFLKKILLTTAEGQARKERYVALLAAQMQLDALEAKISGDISSNIQRPGVAWTQRILSSPNDRQRPRVNDTFIDVHQLHIDGIAIRGVLVIAPTQADRHDLRHANLQNPLMVPPHQPDPLVLYTPDAPDGKRFRQYASSHAMQVALPALRDYLTARAPLANRADLDRALVNNLAGSTLNKVPIYGNFLDQLYAAEVDHAIANVDAQSTSTAAMNRQTAWNTVTTVLGAASFVLPVKITLPLALGRSMWSVWSGFEALKRADQDAAITEFIEAATHVLDAAFDAGGARLVRSSWHHRPSSLPAALNVNAALKTTPTGLRLRSDGNFQDVYEKISRAGSPAQYYIQESGLTYQIRYDRDLSTWRLLDARRPDAFYHDPIRKNSLGHWEIATDIGLRGGGVTASSLKKKSAAAPLKVKQVQLPMDGIIENSLPHRYAVQGYNVRLPNNDIQAVIYDVDLGSWRSLLDNGEIGNPVWRMTTNEWKSGTIAEFQRQQHTQPATTSFKKISLVEFPDLLPAQVIPKQIHYIWNGDMMPENLLQNIADNVRNSKGFTSIVHVDVDRPDIFATIQRDLLRKASAVDPTSDVQVRNLRGTDFFNAFKQTPTGEMYQFFRQGHGKNYSAASDALRYKLLETYGGIYLDTDDSIVRQVTQINLRAGIADILLNAPVEHADTGFSGYNTSNFATQPKNPVLTEINDEMLNRYNANKPHFANRPYLTNTTAQAFAAYQKKIFETTGPVMFNDVLKKQVPDYYDLHEYGIDFDRSGIVSANYQARLEQWEQRYLPFASQSFEVNIGSEQSMTHT